MSDNEITSLMMVTYNRLNLTKETIKSIYETINIPFNLIIIDNNSTDGSVEYLNNLSKEKDNIHLYLNKENKGIAKGRNKALKVAVDLNSDWYCTIDNDVTFNNGWLEDCISVLKSNLQYGAVGVNYENVQYPIVKIGGGFEIQDKPKGNLGTATACFNKKIQKMIGFFNEEYKIYAHEDADFFFRIKHVLGLKIGYLKQPGVHLGEGENDVGPYREMKNLYHKQNLEQFYKNCRMYMARQKNIYIPYVKDE